MNLSPVTYTESTGLMDDVDVTFLALKFRTSEGTPYEKGGNKVIPLLQVDMLPDGTEDVHSQYYSCGDLAKLTPSPNGETLIGNAISKSCNAAMFLLSLVQNGLPDTKLSSERISDLVGIKAHVVRTKRPKDNIARAAGAREPEVLLVNRIISMPGESAKTGANTSAATSVATAGQSAGNASPSKRDPIPSNGTFGDGELGMLAMQVLSEHGGSLKKLALMQEVFKAASSGAIPADAKDGDGRPARTTAATRVYSDAFLESQPFWRYDGATITLAT